MSCLATVTVGHEEFMCCRTDSHNLHVNENGCWPPCPDCWGLDLHALGCPTADVIVSGGWLNAQVVWRDNEKPKVRMWHPNRALAKDLEEVVT